MRIRTGINLFYFCAPELTRRNLVSQKKVVKVVMGRGYCKFSFSLCGCPHGWRGMGDFRGFSAPGPETAPPPPYPPFFRPYGHRRVERPDPFDAHSHWPK